MDKSLVLSEIDREVKRQQERKDTIPDPYLRELVHNHRIFSAPSNDKTTELLGNVNLSTDRALAEHTFPTTIEEVHAKTRVRH